MKIETTEVALTVTLAQAQMLVFAMEMACDAQDPGTAFGLNVERELRAVQQSLKLKISGCEGSIVERIGWAALSQAAIGCAIMADGLVDEHDLVTVDLAKITEAQKVGLVEIVAALKAIGVLR